MPKNTIADLSPIRVKRTPVKIRKRPAFEPSPADEAVWRLEVVGRMLRLPAFRGEQAMRERLLSAGMDDLFEFMFEEMSRSRVDEIRDIAMRFAQLGGY